MRPKLIFTYWGDWGLLECAGLMHLQYFVQWSERVRDRKRVNKLLWTPDMILYINLKICTLPSSHHVPLFPPAGLSEWGRRCQVIGCRWRWLATSWPTSCLTCSRTSGSVWAPFNLWISQEATADVSLFWGVFNVNVFCLQILFVPAERSHADSAENGRQPWDQRLPEGIKIHSLHTLHAQQTHCLTQWEYSSPPSSMNSSSRAVSPSEVSHGSQV